MSDQLTIQVNGKEYALNENLKQSLEERAEIAFEGNRYVDFYWKENGRGDPILVIDTAGEMVPVDRLERLEFEYQDVDSEEREDIDNGNGVKSVPKEDVDLNPGDGPNSPNEEAEVPDTSFMVTHPNKNYVPQPEEDDSDKVPPHPDELPEDPTYVQWVPEDDSLTEHWSTGRTLIPLDQFVEWNLQSRADEAPDGSMKKPSPEKEVPKTTRHDEWEKMLERNGCEVVATKQPTHTPDIPEEDNSQSGYNGRSREDIGGKFDGNNWNV